MRVEREPVDLDRDGLEALLVVLVLIVVAVLLLGVVGELALAIPRMLLAAPQTLLVAQLVVGVAVHLPLNVAAATAKAAATGATSWTRNTLAPRSSAITFVAIVPGRRSAASGKYCVSAIGRAGPANA